MNPEGFALKRFATPQRQPGTGGNTEYRYESSISAIQPGALVLGPAELTFSVRYMQTNRPRSPFATNRRVTRSFNKKTDTVSVSVRPLPDEGKPESFTGAVGKFRMNVTAAPEKLFVSDPLIIDSRISGVGNFDRLTAPVLSDLDGWKLQPARQYIENRSNGLAAGTTAFSQVAQPKRVLARVPPLVFSFFDPEAEAYVTLESDPLPLTVESAPDSSSKLEGKDFSVPVASVPEEELADILTAIQDPGKLYRADGSDAPEPYFLRFVVVTSVLSVVAIMAIGIRRRWKEWNGSRAAAAENLVNCPSSDLLKELALGGKPAMQFYTLAGECIESICYELGEMPMNHEVEEIVTRAHFYQYGATPGKAAEAVNPSERQRVISLLEAWKNGSEGTR